MNNIALLFGTILMFVGGGLLVMALSSLPVASPVLRGLHSAIDSGAFAELKSLIFEYRKNRREFLRWKEGNDGKTD